MSLFRRFRYAPDISTRLPLPSTSRRHLFRHLWALGPFSAGILAVGFGATNRAISSYEGRLRCNRCLPQRSSDRSDDRREKPTCEPRPDLDTYHRQSSRFYSDAPGDYPRTTSGAQWRSVFGRGDGMDYTIRHGLAGIAPTDILTTTIRDIYPARGKRKTIWHLPSTLLSSQLTEPP